jgi:hypothetical protein
MPTRTARYGHNVRRALQGSPVRTLHHPLLPLRYWVLRTYLYFHLASYVPSRPPLLSETRSIRFFWGWMDIRQLCADKRKYWNDRRWCIRLTLLWKGCAAQVLCYRRYSANSVEIFIRIYFSVLYLWCNGIYGV